MQHSDVLLQYIMSHDGGYLWLRTTIKKNKHNQIYFAGCQVTVKILEWSEKKATT